MQRNDHHFPPCVNTHLLSIWGVVSELSSKTPMFHRSKYTQPDSLEEVLLSHSHLTANDVVGMRSMYVWVVRPYQSLVGVFRTPLSPASVPQDCPQNLLCSMDASQSL
eukprot:Blabericola_migrator_1__3691@NODE_2103_length_3269_cov_19_410056_g563_i2_p2_GENE_NODE_2103_length_3269_cov_19_410056_g563_i2NODE_2103_length_3269_cov_19_410056_g563_i2_p2_ORF_typecomplete_len108_score12_61_NODE_2103_length_3269_cov_19_410056_g563_i212921615